MLNITGDRKPQRDIDSDLNLSVMSELAIENDLRRNQEKLMYQPENISLGKYRVKQKLTKNEECVIRGIEKIKMRRQRRLEDKLFKEELKQIQQEELKNEIRRELDKRKVEHGVIGNKKKQFKKRSLIRDSSIEHDEPNKKDAKIELYDFSLEEKKDQNAIKNFISKYRKLLQFLFKSYANTGYSHKQINSFDQMHDRLETMSLAEAIIMLKKNSIIPDLLHKDEAKTLLRLVNSHILGDKREGKSLTFEAFNSYFLQVAMLVFSREPINLSQKPPIESIMALLKLFEKSALQRRESIKLFENPDHTIIADDRIIKELNKILKKNPDAPMPDGFKKIKIKEYKNIYKIPDYMPIPEKNKIALEILDDLLNQQFGFHIFEPFSRPVYTYKAKPVLKHLMKYPMGKKDVPYILKKPPVKLKSKAKGKNKARLLDPIPTNDYKSDRHSTDRVSIQNRSKAPDSKFKRNKSHQPIPKYETSDSEFGNNASINRKRVYNEITPDINLNLKLEIVKYPTRVRDYAQEVAEVLEEVLQATEKGLDKLPPRKKYGFHAFMNKAQQAKQKKLEEEVKKAEHKKNKYEHHKESLHNRLKKMREEKKKAESERRVQDNQKRVRLREKKKKQIEDAKARVKAREERDKKKQEDIFKSLNEPYQLTEKEVRDKQKRMMFLNNGKNQMKKEFNNFSKKRKVNNTEDEKEREKLLNKEKDNKLKQYFEKQKELKAQNDVAKKEYLQFYESPEIQNTFEANFETISESYLNFAKQQKYMKNPKPSDFQMTFAQFKKFGHNMKIYPKIVSFDDFSHIFQMITKEKDEKNKELAEKKEEKYDAKETLNITFNEFKDALMKLA